MLLLNSLETCPVITIQKVREEGKYFYATEPELRKLFNYDGWTGDTMEIIQEGKCGGGECWKGEIMAWDNKSSREAKKGETSHGRRSCKDTSVCSTNPNEPCCFKAGQWSPGDTIKSIACELGNNEI